MRREEVFVLNPSGRWASTGTPSERYAHLDSPTNPHKSGSRDASDSVEDSLSIVSGSMDHTQEFTEGSASRSVSLSPSARGNGENSPRISHNEAGQQVVPLGQASGSILGSVSTPPAFEPGSQERSSVPKRRGDSHASIAKPGRSVETDKATRKSGQDSMAQKQEEEQSTWGLQSIDETLAGLDDKNNPRLNVPS